MIEDLIEWNQWVWENDPDRLYMLNKEIVSINVYCVYERINNRSMFETRLKLLLKAHTCKFHLPWSIFEEKRKKKSNHFIWWFWTANRHATNEYVHNQSIELIQCELYWCAFCLYFVAHFSFTANSLTDFLLFLFFCIFKTKTDFFNFIYIYNFFWQLTRIHWIWIRWKL